MSGDGSDLDVSKQALALIAQGITASLAELKELGSVGTASMGGGFTELALSGMETGHESLASTLGTFCERWGWGVRSLVQQGNMFALNVGLSAGAVYEQDQYIQGSFKVVANAALGNPYAEEKDIIAKDWGEVLSDNPITQIKNADYEPESFAHASENGNEAWKSAVRDLNSSDILLSNQIIDAVGLRDEADALVDGTVGPAPEAQPGGAGR
ncbi:hypothetical protein GCM10010425_24900 [Streptomyces spororaveus]|uniref:Uncharacterized protein n=1 Tax=Streptomyces spororaveus TaxID=284039 RepID=A0ABQ3TGM6_9ACTN|nr:hypothetical protein [Streptomyces spororaveus]MCM9080110.1 hypothetical protein [Streptomyces spororaveus]GHI79573.1 hypothetical protein Sspor_51340 [Streptomyces spororaveus]